MRAILCGVSAVFLAAAPAAAGTINYVIHVRAVSTSAGVGGGLPVTDQKETMALGSWSETSTAAYSDANGGASATADQTSDLGDQQISMSGSLSAGSTPGYAGVAQSRLTVDFSVASDSPYVSALSVSGDAAPAFSFYRAETGFPSFDANSSGVLSAGEYALVINFTVAADVTGSSVSGSYGYRLDVTPEPSSVVLALVGGLLLVAARRTYARRQTHARYGRSAPSRAP